MLSGGSDVDMATAPWTIAMISFLTRTRCFKCPVAQRLDVSRTNPHPFVEKPSRSTGNLPTHTHPFPGGRGALDAERAGLQIVGRALSGVGENVQSWEMIVGTAKAVLGITTTKDAWHMRRKVRFLVLWVEIAGLVSGHHVCHWVGPHGRRECAPPFFLPFLPFQYLHTNQLTSKQTWAYHRRCSQPCAAAHQSGQ